MENVNIILTFLYCSEMSSVTKNRQFFSFSMSQKHDQLNFF